MYYYLSSSKCTLQDHRYGQTMIEFNIHLVRAKYQFTWYIMYLFSKGRKNQQQHTPDVVDKQ